VQPTAAYIQRLRGAQLLPPGGLSSALIRINPSFDPSSQEPLLLTAAVDDAFGTAHLRVGVGACGISVVPRFALVGFSDVCMVCSLSSRSRRCPHADSNAHAQQHQQQIPVPPGTKPGDYSLSVLTPSDTPSGGSAPVSSAPALARPATRGRLLHQSRAPAAAAAVVIPPPGAPAAQSAAGFDTVSTATFTVADPRPPTAELNVTAPKWVKPDARVVVRLVARSYVGTQVEGADVTVSWSLPKASGNVTVSYLGFLGKGWGGVGGAWRA